MGITYKDVAIAAEKILAEGKIPTISRIYQIIGGSKSLIAKHLKELKYQNIRTVAPIASHLTETPEENLEDLILKRTQELEKSLSLVRATFEATADGILVLSREGKVAAWNEKFMKMWRLSPDLLQSQNENVGFQSILSQVSDPEGMVALVNRLYDNPNEKGTFGEIYFKDGRIFERYTQPNVIDGQIIGRVWSFRDVTERKRTEENLRLRERAIEASTNGIIIVDAIDPKQPILYVNPAFERITGYSSQEVIGQNCRILQKEDTEQPELQKIRLAIKEKQKEHAILRNYRKNGELFWNELHFAPVPNLDKEITHFVGIVSDVTQRKAMEEQLIHQATHDILTLLPNRLLLLDRIEQAIINAKRSEQMVALLFLDLDQFKLINDSLGHTVGDGVLRTIAERLQRCLREGDTVARIGGDEFVILFPFLAKEEYVFARVQKILETVSVPFIIDGHEIVVTASIGISFYPKDGQDYELLLRNSDLSMYKAKELGRNNYQLYSAEMNNKVKQRLQLETSLRTALERSEFELFYQPIADLKTGRIISVEALLRWNHPVMGSVSPANFIPVAEENGLIVPIGEWVLQTACAECKTWLDAGLSDVSVAVNISGRQFRLGRVETTVSRILVNTGLKAKHLELELTESMLLESVDATINTLRNLKDLGLCLSIDDFGTGYSSLSYLREFPVDKLKIDRSFVTNAVDNFQLISSIIALGHSLKLKVLAEGVETQQQLQILRAEGCDEIQGYYFSKPVNAEEIKRILIERRSLPIAD